MKTKRRDLDSSAFGGAGIPLDETDPMASIANLVDAMLVFACGLLMALTLRYNVDLANVKDVEIEQNLSEVDNIDQMAEDMRTDGAGYTELGTVYQDPATGKMYMIAENSSGAAAPKDEPAGSVAPSRADGAD